jgi:hypothetical protein
MLVERRLSALEIKRSINRRVVYLDTNHLSSLGRHPNRSESSSFRQALADADAAVALSIVHLVELGNPNFKSGDAVGAVLDQIPVVWAMSLDDLWQAEINAAYSVVLGLPTIVQPFGVDVNAAIGGPFVGARPSEAIEAFRDPDLRQEIEQLTVAGLMFDALKTDATLAQDPLNLLQRKLIKHRPERTSSGLNLDAINPDELLRAVGGLAGFPSYGLMHSVATARLRDKKFRASRSDVFDLMHVAYAAYATFTALDRSYAARVRSARRDLAPTVTHRISDISLWLTI